MKNLIFKISTVVFLAVVSMYLSACKKDNSFYHDYVNTIQTFEGSAMEYLKAQPDGTFDSLLLVLDRYPDLADSLTSQQVTLFAPVNKNFQASVKYLNLKRAADGKPSIYLSNASTDELKAIMCKYIIRGNRNTDDYVNAADGIQLQSIITNYPMHVKYVKLSSSGYVRGGASVLNFSDTHGSSFTNAWTIASTNSVNIKTNNATINIISPLHNFGFNEFTSKLDI
ncbi:fasciclin domain-containing protein [Pedobacter frigoris]|uniref:fasciclin domain-containing protein n=1 Tax=Pedobacter frigoris TaxID=2571272 RepID=UPI0029308E4D|nr:fasciclin domain-containing protein [Pedobacter frigoris]